MAEVNFIFKDSKVRKDIKDALTSIFNNFKDESLPQKVNIIKVKLDDILGRGWSVWAGQHLVGSCSCITGTMTEFKESQANYIIYRTYCP
ncbi:hypothetical protein NUSPORA_00644 [Nucleospora cyclopteri]